MDIITLNKELYEVSQRLSQAAGELPKMGRHKAEAERDYRRKLAQETLKLKAEGMSVGMIADVAKGNVAEDLFMRDFAESKFKAAVEVCDVLKVQVSALQTILKYQSDI